MSKIAQLLLEGDFRVVKVFYSNKVILLPHMNYLYLAS